MPKSQQIVEGFTITKKGEATVEPYLADVLFDLGLALECPTGLPVDVEHVMAALVLASRAGLVEPNRKLKADDEELTQSLVPFVKAVFTNLNGKVGKDD